MEANLEQMTLILEMLCQAIETLAVLWKRAEPGVIELAAGAILLRWLWSLIRRR